MIAAGVGCRKGCDGAEIAGLLTAAFDEAALTAAQRAAVRLAVPAIKRDEPGVADAARRLDLPVTVIDAASLAAAQDRTVTRSATVAAAVGLASVAEAAALAAVGPSGRLLLPRRSTPRATVALATDALAALALSESTP
ncbi:cobalamin biosynthesis protein [Azospirillum griseum]|uniref:Cobalamin biosynthesis protein n=1 Tax=Azospirillum griseum TaxID=2496639 RepID=A0A431VAM7_9PROT|nr:cobalamin biosynthesis protein [Azospirillum griseum]RTR14243.1 cobalamin biosynthesis protein [Azospirillum griseum]